MQHTTRTAILLWQIIRYCLKVMKSRRRIFRRGSGAIHGPHPDASVEKRAKELACEQDAEIHSRFFEFIEEIVGGDMQSYRDVPQNGKAMMKSAFWRWLAEEEIYGKEG